MKNWLKVQNTGTYKKWFEKSLPAQNTGTHEKLVEKRFGESGGERIIRERLIYWFVCSSLETQQHKHKTKQEYHLWCSTLESHLEGHISECVNGWDGAGRDAVEVGQHKIPEVLQLKQEIVEIALIFLRETLNRGYGVGGFLTLTR